jgi:GH25 family lysozyme M1 (1,4-beta-N-acetylmuramidase)
MTSFADLSHHNATVDLAAYKAGGHNRIVLKATEGTGFTDPAFTARWRQAGQLGLARVAYHFARAQYNGGDEFDHFLSVVNGAGGLGPRDRLCLDVEDTNTPNRAAANCREFGTRAVTRGVTVGLVYSYRYYMVNHAVAPTQFPTGWRQLWLADYTAGQADTDIELGAGWTRGQVVARQYTDKAAFAGIGGTCDGNRVLHDWLSTPAPTPTKEDEMTPAQMQELKEYIDHRLQYAVWAVQKGGGNTVYDGLVAPEQTALALTEQRLGAKIDALQPPEPAV